METVVYLNPQTLEPDPNGVAYNQITLLSGSVTYEMVLAAGAPTLAEVQSQQIEVLKQSYTNALAEGFTSSATGTAYIYGFDQGAQDDMTQEMEAIDAEFAQEPISWGLLNGEAVDHTIAQMKQVAQDAGTFKWQQVNKLRQLIGKVMTATTTDEVNAITWQ